jgi:uncharacterized membrane protein
VNRAEPFWWKLVLIVMIMGVLLFFYNHIVRKLLKIERKKFWADHYVNETHRKIGKVLNIIFIFYLISNVFHQAEHGPNAGVWLLSPYVPPFIFLIFTETIRAFMQKKYANNKNEYLFTISQLVFSSLLLIVMICTDFAGLI